MSLINDALKRAGQAPPPPAPAATNDMQPVEPPRVARLPLWLVVLAVLPVFTLAVWLVTKSFQITRKARSYLREMPVAAREPASQVWLNPPASATPTTPSPAAPPVANQLPQISATASNTVAIPEPPPVFPALKLQGIYYRPSSPSAVINTKTVYVGDQLDQVKVLAIQADAVTVEWQGQTKVLTFQ